MTFVETIIFIVFIVALVFVFAFTSLLLHEFSHYIVLRIYHFKKIKIHIRILHQSSVDTKRNATSLRQAKFVMFAPAYLISVPSFIVYAILNMVNYYPAFWFLLFAFASLPSGGDFLEYRRIKKLIKIKEKSLKNESRKTKSKRHK